MSYEISAFSVARFFFVFTYTRIAFSRIEIDSNALKEYGLIADRRVMLFISNCPDRAPDEKTAENMLRSAQR